MWPQTYIFFPRDLKRDFIFEADLCYVRRTVEADLYR